MQLQQQIVQLSLAITSHVIVLDKDAQDLKKGGKVQRGIIIPPIKQSMTMIYCATLALFSETPSEGWYKEIKVFVETLPICATCSSCLLGEVVK